MNALKSAGEILLFCMGAVASLGILAGFFWGAEWLSRNVIDALMTGCIWLILACVIILLPCSIFGPTRSFAAYGFLAASFVFGTTVWLMGFSATLSLWGIIAVVAGLFIWGVGVVPIGMVALASHGYWQGAAFLLVGLLLTYGTRAFAFWLAELQDRLAYRSAAL